MVLDDYAVIRIGREKAKSLSSTHQTCEVSICSAVAAAFSPGFSKGF